MTIEASAGLETREELKPRGPYITFDGPPGVGKSEIAKLFNAVEEPYLENPWLSKFYKDPKKFAIHSQIFFLTQDAANSARYSELLTKTHIIKDAGVIVNSIIAETQRCMDFITNEDSCILNYLTSTLYRHIPEPDISVMLTASDEKILSGIKERGRQMEVDFMEEYPDYFPRLIREFRKWTEQNRHKRTVVEIDVEDVDFTPGVQIPDGLIADIKARVGYHVAKMPLSFPSLLRPPPRSYAQHSVESLRFDGT